MKLIPIFATQLLLAIAALAQDAAPDFEAAPVLHASEILKPEFLAGPDYRVLENVTTFYGRNRYTIETRWGYLTAESDALLAARVAEVRAIAELERVSRTEEFKTGLVAAAKTPYHAVRGAIDDPAGAVKGTAKGVWKFMNRAGESVKNATQHRERGQGEDNAGKQLLGLSKAKRTLALQLGADPYSSNEVFQAQLENVAWVNTAGTGLFKIATMPIGGGAGMVLSASSATQTFQQSLRDLSPADLRLANKKQLIAMGVEPRKADQFLANPAISPTNQTAIVLALRALDGVKNRAAFVTVAAETVSEESDAVFCSGTAQLLATLHAGADKIARLTTVGGFPVAITADGRLVIALQWDTAFWSEATARFIDRAATAQLGQTGPPVIAITGGATERTKAELEKRGIHLLSHALDGPQK